MKKITKIAVLAAGLATLFLAGCNNIVTEVATVEGVTSKSAVPLTINVSSDSDLISFTNPKAASRSILPEAYDSTKVKFYLCYKETTAATYTAAPQEVTFVGKDDPDNPGTVLTKEGTVVINLDLGNYDLELFAVKNDVAKTSYASESVVKTDACLMGIAQADLRYSQPVSFFLTSEGLTGTGNVKLKLFAQGWNPADYEGYEVKASMLYTKDTKIGGSTKGAGTKVAGSDLTLVNSTGKISDVIPADAAGAVNYSVSDVAPGTYLFEITFQKDGEETVFYWNDDIKVLPYADTNPKDGIAISPVIDLPPEAPADFKVGYIDNLKSEYYSAEFVWDGDEIKNETCFELDLLTLSSSVTDADVTAAPQDDTEWESLVNACGANPVNVQYKNDFVGSTVYSSGSLGKNSEVATFRLAYGKRYAARIRAVNEIGVSDWTYCDISTGIAEDQTAKIAEATGFGSSTINRFKVTYNLSGGDLKDESGTAVANVYACSQLFVEDSTSVDPTDYFEVEGATKTYYTYTGGVEIMNPNGDVDFVYDDKGNEVTVEKPILKLNDQLVWTNWTLNGEAYNVIGSRPKPYGGYENIEFVANFATTATVVLFDDHDYQIASVEPANVAFLGDDGESHYYVKWSQETDTEETWKIKAPEGVVYDSVTVKLYRTSSKTEYYTVAVTYSPAADEYTASFKISQYKTGIYRAEIAAYSSVRPDDPYTAQVGVIIED